MPSRSNYRSRGISPTGWGHALLTGENTSVGGAVRDEKYSLGYYDQNFYQLGSNASTMYDEYGPKILEGDYSIARHTDHIKLISSSVPASVDQEWHFGPYEGQIRFNLDGVPGPGDDLRHYDAHCPHPPPSVTTPFAHRALIEMTSQFPPEVDIVNFLHELKDIISPIQNLQDIRDLVYGMGIRNAGASLKEVSDIWASYNFGTSPIPGDFSAIYNTLHNVKNRLEWLRKTRNKWVRVGSRQTYSNSDKQGIGNFGFPWAPTIGVTRISTSGKLTCTARVKQNLPWVDTWEGWVRGVIGLGTINRPFAVCWEAIPFSWAVDYFFPVGEYLKSVVFEDITDWITRDVCWSFKSTYAHRLDLFDEYGQVIRKVGSFALQRYWRGIGFPPVIWYLKTPSIKQISLLAAAGS